MKQKGMLTVDELKTLIDKDKIRTVIVGFTDHYGRLMGKRYDAEFFYESALNSGAHACDYMLTTDMDMEPLPGFQFANWELGYGDFHLVPDFSTLRKVSWLKKTALILCDIHDNESHEPISVSPRQILQAQTERLADMSYTAKAASELEYYLLEESYRTAHDKNYHELTPAGWYLEDYHILQGSRTEEYTEKVRHHLSQSGIPVETSKGEWGLGQHEINIRYASVTDMADRHIVYKQCMKEIADKMELSVTFMAKYHTDRAGSSCHIHLSLWSDGQNVFAGEEDFCGIKCSPLFRWFLGGWIAHVEDVMPFYAPTINSYKRYTDGSWAPTRLAWSRDNRTAGFRVVGSGQSLRIECRIPGADCNPYLAMAASIASGLDGIEQQIEPPAAFVGDIYEAKHLPRVAYTLEEAVAKFKQSAFAQKAFGSEVVEHYSHFYEKEIEAHRLAVSDWERRRYFERI